VRYVRTSDGKLVVSGNDKKSFQAQYLADHVHILLQAAVFGEDWDNVWAKLADVPVNNRLGALRSAILYVADFFGDLATKDVAQLPTFALRS
jgi:hypothetical protein